MKNNLAIIKNQNIWFSISGILVIAAIFALAVWGINFGIDFRGGSLLEVDFKADRPAAAEARAALADLALGSLTVQPIGESGMIIRFRETGEDDHQSVLSRLRGLAAGESAESQDEEIAGGLVEELRFDSVGPSIGAELKSRSFYAIIFVLAAMILYIAWAFRKVSKPVASWKYGLTAIIALFHDVIITLGIFAVMGKFWQIEINTPFVAAILTVMGYSINDTIVVFDRIRENLPKSDEDYESTVNTSVNQTLARSVYTSFTTLLVLLAIIFFGGATIREFVLALAIGIFIGTYSSIFLASPILTVWEKRQNS